MFSPDAVLCIGASWPDAPVWGEAMWPNCWQVSGKMPKPHALWEASAGVIHRHYAVSLSRSVSVEVQCLLLRHPGLSMLVFWRRLADSSTKWRGQRQGFCFSSRMRPVSLPFHLTCCPDCSPLDRSERSPAAIRCPSSLNSRSVIRFQTAASEESVQVSVSPG